MKPSPLAPANHFRYLRLSPVDSPFPASDAFPGTSSKLFSLSAPLRLLLVADIRSALPLGVMFITTVPVGLDA